MYRTYSNKTFLWVLTDRKWHPVSWWCIFLASYRTGAPPLGSMTPPPNPQHSIPAHSVGGNLQSLWKCGTIKRVNYCVLGMLSWSRKTSYFTADFLHQKSSWFTFNKGWISGCWGLHGLEELLWLDVVPPQGGVTICFWATTKPDRTKWKRNHKNSTNTLIIQTVKVKKQQLFTIYRGNKIIKFSQLQILLRLHKLPYV